jgi:hypothetical protein
VPFLSVNTAELIKVTLLQAVAGALHVPLRVLDGNIYFGAANSNLSFAQLNADPI